MDPNHEVFGVTENDHADVKRLSFEKAIEELESIVKRLEEGKVPLEESVAIYERGKRSSAAARNCCARPRHGSRRSRSTAPANRRAASRWTWDRVSFLRRRLSQLLP